MRLFLIALLFCGCVHASKGQSNTKQVYNFEALNDLPDVNPAMDISNLSVNDYNKLIDKMYVADQKFRAFFFHENRRVLSGQYPTISDKEIARYNRLWKINDIANQALLLRLLEAYKWPTQLGRDGSSVKAWYIAWHAPPHLGKRFYPFMVEAVESKVLGKKTLDQYRLKMN